MKIRIPFAVASIALMLLSCDEPIAYNNDTFIYNPFVFTEDTLNVITSIESGEGDIEWGPHFRAWVGETQYYKSGFTADFSLSDTLDITNVDSIQFQFKHVKTYPQNGADTLSVTHSAFGFYETMDQSIDVLNSAYGIYLGSDSMNISGGQDSWTYTLPASVILEGDTSVSLGVFPAITNYLSSVYGGGSTFRPTLNFFYHEADTAGDDIATSIEFLADTLIMHLAEKSTAFDRTQYDYISQLKTDSLILTLDLTDFELGIDTLRHIINSSILPAINDLASALYMPDSVFRFNMQIEEPVSGRTTIIEYGGDNYHSNEINFIIQSAIDDNKSELDLILGSSNPGYNPGFIAISKVLSQSALYVKSSLAVRP